MATSSSRQRKRRSSRRKKKQSRYLRYGWPAFLVGILLATVYLKVNSSKGIVTEDSPLGFAATVSAVRQAVASNGWDEAGVVDVAEWLAAQNVDFPLRTKIIKVNSGYDTRDMLLEDGSRSCLIPWSVAVWEDDAGRVKVSYPGEIAGVVDGALKNASQGEAQ